MLRRILRAAVPVLIVAGGIALLLHGALASSVLVVVMHEEPQTIEVRQPPPLSPPPAPPPTGLAGLLGLRQPPPLPPAPPPIRKTVTIQVFKPVETREPDLVREVTFGGVTRLANGELKRTYTDHAPTLCPT